MRGESREAGNTLAELMVATTVLLIVVTMTYLIVTVVVKQVVTGTATGVAAETAQSQIVTIDDYLRGAISPASADAEYGISGICSAAPSSTTAVQQAYDYLLELCSARPSSTTSCTAANESSTQTACPQLYLIYLDKATCTTAGRCALKVVDLSVSSAPLTFSSTLFRCPSGTNSCQADLVTESSLPGTVTVPSGHEASTTGFPYLFSYFDSSGTTQLSGATTSTIQSVHVDMQALNNPTSPVSTSQKYTEITDGIWLTNAAEQQRGAL